MALTDAQINARSAIRETAHLHNIVSSDIRLAVTLSRVLVQHIGRFRMEALRNGGRHPDEGVQLLIETVTEVSLTSA